MTVEWTAENAAHLLRRATFGARQKEVAKALAKGLDATIAGLFKKPEPDAFDGFKDVYLDQLQAWWLRRMLATKAPLLEKLTLMWHNHFATGFAKVENAKFMQLQNRAIRKHALGSFRDLVTAVSQSAAMLIWLDGETNVKEDPNENFARELMELFTTGVLDKDGNPNYTEQDVVEAARAFTGWSYDYWNGAFAFHDYDHDFGLKTFKGQTAGFHGDAIIDILVAEPATARRVAWRLWTSFAYAVALNDPVLDPLEALYLSNGGQIRPLVEAMFRSDAFYSVEAKHAKVKNPCEFLIGSLRLLQGKFNSKLKYVEYDIAEAIDSLGQSIFDPPSVFGWKEHLAWASSNGMFARARYANAVAVARKGSSDTFQWNPKKLLPQPSKWAALTPHDVVATMLAVLDLANAQPSTVDALVAYLQTDELGNFQPFVLSNGSLGLKFRGLVALILSAPEYQLA